MAAHVREKGVADYVTQVDIAVQDFLKKGIIHTCARHTISRRGNWVTADGYGQLLDS